MVAIVFRPLVVVEHRNDHPDDRPGVSAAGTAPDRTLVTYRRAAWASRIAAAPRPART
jgi:hypothetical protein